MLPINLNTDWHDIRDEDALYYEDRLKRNDRQSMLSVCYNTKWSYTGFDFHAKWDGDSFD